MKIECAEEGRNGHRIDSSRDNLLIIRQKSNMKLYKGLAEKVPDIPAHSMTS